MKTFFFWKFFTLEIKWGGFQWENIFFDKLKNFCRVKLSLRKSGLRKTINGVNKKKKKKKHFSGKKYICNKIIKHI